MEITGKTITNIFELLKYEDSGLDLGECLIELDNIGTKYSASFINDAYRL